MMHQCSSHCPQTSSVTQRQLPAVNHGTSSHRETKSVMVNNPRKEMSTGSLLPRAKHQPERASLVFLMHDVLNGASYDWISDLSADEVERLASYAQPSWFDVMGYTFFYTPTYEVTTTGKTEGRPQGKGQCRQDGDAAWIVYITTYEVLGDNRGGSPYTFKSNPIPLSTIKRMRDNIRRQAGKETSREMIDDPVKPEIHEILVGKILSQISQQQVK